MTNPLLTYAEFAPYAQIQAEHIVPATKQAIVESQETLNKILDTWRSGQALTFDSTLGALIEMEDITSKVWTPVENLLSLNGTDELREQAEIARPLLVEFYNEYSLNADVYQMIKDYAASSEAQNLVGERKRHLENTLKDFKLSGAELQGKDKEEFKELNLKLSDLTQKFSDNVTDSKFELVITDQADLRGLPEDIINAAKHKADELRVQASIPEDAYVFNLDYPSYIPFMKFADSSELRKTMYLKYLTKATDKASVGLVGKAKVLDNTNLTKEIFAARLRQAQLLGYKNYAELSLETKMADNPEAVKAFLERLALKTKKLAQSEYQELVSFQQQINYQNSENDPNTVYPWDKDYLQEKLRKQKYDFDSNLLKPYFELERVIDGMFAIAEHLYQVSFRQVHDIEIWDKDLRVYEVLEKNSSARTGFIYMDLFPRDVKRQGAWVMPLVPAYTRTDGSRVVPQCTLACNLTKPMQARPSLLTQMEVVTLFHEFGHALHHLFSTVELAPLSGTDVEWDFVELPSQLNENFAWERESLNLFAKHYQTGENIPEELLTKMLKARFFNEGLACVRQLEFALFDLNFYMQESLSKKTAKDIFMDIANQYGVFKVHPETNFPNSFSHIFAGGYAAGYYSYKWAEILEADAFAKFKNAGVLSAKVGREYRNKILSQGDSRPPKELFVDFMGREPSEEALLERMGLSLI